MKEGECDCCGEWSKTIVFLVWLGIDTYACAKCRHDFDEEDEE